MFKILDMIKHLSLNGSLIFTSLFLCICLLVSVWQWQAVDLIFTNLLPLLAHPAPSVAASITPLTPSALMCNWQQQLAPGGNQRQLPSWSRSSSGRHISKLEIPEKQGDSKSRTLIVYGLSRPDGRVLRTVNWTPSGKWRGTSVWKAEIHSRWWKLNSGIIRSVENGVRWLLLKSCLNVSNFFTSWRNMLLISD